MKPRIEKINQYKVLLCGNVPQSIYPLPEGGYWLEMVPEKEPKSVLILGFGGGTIARAILKRYPKAKITGVENNPEIFSLSKKHMKLDEIKAKIIEEDAFKFVYETHKEFDLIIVDLWDGSQFQVRIFSPEFIEQCKRLLTDGGNIYINCPHLDQLAIDRGIQVRTEVGPNLIYKYEHELKN